MGIYAENKCVKTSFILKNVRRNGMLDIGMHIGNRWWNISNCFTISPIKTTLISSEDILTPDVNGRKSTAHSISILVEHFICKHHRRINESWLMKTRQIWGIWKLRPAYSPVMPNLGQNRWCLVPCDLEIWWMTLEHKRASLLYCFKLCATFHSHSWIQTGVTVRKRPIWVKFDDF